VTSTDLYTRHPHRIREAHAQRLLTFTQQALVHWFVSRLDHPSRVQELHCTLLQLIEELSWEHSPEWLRQNLHAIRGWVVFETRRGPNAVWTFRLAGARVNGDFQLDRPSELEIQEGTWKSDAAASAHPVRRRAGADGARVANRPSLLRKGREVKVLGKTTPEQDQVVGEGNRENTGGGSLIDDDELRVLTDQAFELRDTPYAADAVQAIQDWHDRRGLRRWERDGGEQ
jgi:hypothetical protein